MNNVKLDIQYPFKDATKSKIGLLSLFRINCMLKLHCVWAICQNKIVCTKYKMCYFIRTLLGTIFTLTVLCTTKGSKL